jgi:hypothetical protein
MFLALSFVFVFHFFTKSNKHMMNRSYGRFVERLKVIDKQYCNCDREDFTTAQHDLPSERRQTILSYFLFISKLELSAGINSIKLDLGPKRLRTIFYFSEFQTNFHPKTI